MAVNWAEIKAEYLTTDTSYRDLAQKYGVNTTTIAKKAGKEGWVEQRQQQANRTLSKTLTAISNREASRASRLSDVAGRLLDKVERLMDMDDRLQEASDGESIALGAKEMKSIAGVLKDIKDVQMIRSDIDLREQEARIKKLEREAESDDGGDVVIRIEGGDASWSR